VSFTAAAIASKVMDFLAVAIAVLTFAILIAGIEAVDRI
jgi:hypothetical protein